MFGRTVLRCLAAMDSWVELCSSSLDPKLPSTRGPSVAQLILPAARSSCRCERRKRLQTASTQDCSVFLSVSASLNLLDSRTKSYD